MAEAVSPAERIDGPDLCLPGTSRTAPRSPAASRKLTVRLLPKGDHHTIEDLGGPS
jgi:hypothetical protein